jgi:hypothetical protein
MGRFPSVGYVHLVGYCNYRKHRNASPGDVTLNLPFVI